MQGVLFNIDEGFIGSQFQAGKLEEILHSCKLETKEPFAAPKTKPDSDLKQIVYSGREVLSILRSWIRKRFGLYVLY